MAISSLHHLLFFSILLVIITGVSVHGQCLEDQKALLLKLKSELKFNSSYSKKLVHWNKTHDCCSWGGVKCDYDGHVTGLDLSNESISGEINNSSTLFGLIYLKELELYSNSLSGEIPHAFFILKNLFFLSLSNNLFNGTFQQKKGVYYLGPFPPAVDSALHEPFSHLFFLSLANNSLSGELPTFLCNVSNLQVLDLSFNNFTGNIPPCILGNLYFLEFLNMRGNNFNGSIPDINFPYRCGLSTLDLSHNDLAGNIPMSLALCHSLKVLNIGYNNFKDIFPCMLRANLRVLVLRSNKFHGELRCNRRWPNLQILDLSFNNFNGSLHPLNFSSWRGMILKSDAHSHSKNNIVSGDGYYQVEVTLTMKGVERKLVKIWPEFTFIDFSSNNFQGDIPHAIGNLFSLYLLNLSHNALTGTIPTSLGALTELESLDISANKLIGRIPEELARLTFLSFLNLSNNKLMGAIPYGPQFRTFSANSFEGNKDLCGFPLNRSCSYIGGTLSKSKHEGIEWEYVFAALGYAVGLGSIFWILLCWRSFRERYFEKIEEVVEEIFDWRDRRRREERRRRVERRNEFRRQQQRS